MPIWSIFEGPLINLALAIVLLALAFTFLDEYRRLFMSDPKNAMSFEILFQVITGTGGPGYIAAFLLAGAGLSLICAVLSLLLNLSLYLSR
jgi:hypothetical protein